MNLIRKLTVGPDFKGGQHFVKGQNAHAGHTVSNILVEGNKYRVYIAKEGEEKLWKEGVNNNIAIEYNLDY